MTMEPRLRASSRLLVALSLTLIAGAGLSAHRLDEYLQAARIDLRQDGVSIELDLTPGAALAESVIEAIDRDRDRVMSIVERQHFVTDVVGQVQARLDGTMLALLVTSSSFPTLDALRAGEGTIRVQLHGRHPTLSSGRHQLSFDNGYLPGRSVYLANALVPATTRVSVTAQRRSVDQRAMTIDYVVGPTLAGVGSNGLLVGLMVSLLIVRYARRNGVRP